MTSKIVYQGNLRTEAKHFLSGEIIHTDAPVDNHGQGEKFSPTDLTATSLASCMLTIAGIAAHTHGIEIEGSEAEVTKEMASNPRRIATIRVRLKMRGQSEYTDKQKAIIEQAARTCPVAQSIHPDIEQDVDFDWP